jgi:hypothetical protein
MSYLDWPRIHIGGAFFTDPSTVNNDPAHYKEDVTRPSPWQEPNGLHRFQFVDVKVLGAVDADGKFVEKDPIIGVTANSTDLPTPAKIVDLDVYQQGVSTIFGFQLQLSFSALVNLIGTMDPCCCNGLWWNRVLPTRGWQPWDEYDSGGGFGGDTFACAAFVSVLRIPASSWPDATGSVLDALRAATTTDADNNVLLSIRMVLDSYDNVPWHQNFRHGRVAATLGPVLPGELAHIVGGRWLQPYPGAPPQIPNPQAPPPWNWPSLFNAPFRFIKQASGADCLVIDLADAIAMEQVGGAPVPLGAITAFLGDGSTGPLGAFQVTQDLYQNLGGIVDLEIDSQQWQAQRQQLILTTDRNDIGGLQNPKFTGRVLWQEDDSGLVIDANDQVFRLQGHKGETAIATVNCTRFGTPLAGLTPAVLVQPVYKGINGASVPWEEPGATGDTPDVDGFLSATASPIDGAGNCTITLTVNGGPPSRTSQLDGQLYFVLPYIGNQPPDLTKVAPRQESLISAVVYSPFPYDNPPDWETVKKMMTPYAKLYPGMTEQIDLTQQQAFFTFACNPPWQAFDGPNAVHYKLPNGATIAAGAIPYLLTRDFNSTRYMPISRDLSNDKRLYLLYYVAWLQSVVKPTPPPPDTP